MGLQAWPGGAGGGPGPRHTQTEAWKQPVPHSRLPPGSWPPRGNPSHCPPATPCKGTECWLAPPLARTRRGFTGLGFGSPQSSPGHADCHMTSNNCLLPSLGLCLMGVGREGVSKPLAISDHEKSGFLSRTALRALSIPQPLFRGLLGLRASVCLAVERAVTVCTGECRSASQTHSGPWGSQLQTASPGFPAHGFWQDGASGRGTDYSGRGSEQGAMPLALPARLCPAVALTPARRPPGVLGGNSFLAPLRDPCVWPAPAGTF